MICIHHDKDLDGFTSGAIAKLRYPDATLLGWDYDRPTPVIEPGQDVILVDISFHTIEDIYKIAGEAKSFKWIDHHVSAYNKYNEYREANNLPYLDYFYDNNHAACELMWAHCFPGLSKSLPVKLLGKYDIWKGHGTKEWNDCILPFQMFMRLKCNSADTFPMEYLDRSKYAFHNELIPEFETGKSLLRFQEMANEMSCSKNAFRRVALGGYNAICLNQAFIGSDTFKSIYNDKFDDIMIGFHFNGNEWIVSLRSTEDSGVNCSAIALERKGGGHKNAAGFSVKNFEDIFK